LPKRLEALVGAMKSERVWLALPKFEIDPPGSLSLGEELVAHASRDGRVP